MTTARLQFGNEIARTALGRHCWAYRFLLYDGWVPLAKVENYIDEDTERHQRWYCSSLTCSIQSTTFPSSFS
jgi:hypothetical protein